MLFRKAKPISSVSRTARDDRHQTKTPQVCPKTGRYLKKYLKGVASIPLEDRVRFLRLIENITMGTGAVGYLTESIHGAGSPQAQKVMIGRFANLDQKKALAKKIAGVN